MQENFSGWKKFPATEDAYENIRDFIIDAAKNFNVQKENLLRLELGIEEIVINIIHYAYKDGGDIFVKVYDDEPQNIFYFELADYGTPFNPLDKIDPRSIDKSEIQDRKLGGFGIAFVKKTFVNLSYAYEDFQGQKANLLTLGFIK
ncbi:MAG: ATP-binding protein [Selenomonadaceae bacterium]|nr:ATP-binding protein [Selenomonadaceae bacterium]